MSLSVPHLRNEPVDPAPGEVSPGGAARRERFVLTRLTLGAAGLACLPPLLAWGGGPSRLDALLALCLAAPLAAAAIVSRTGRLALGFGVAGAGAAGLVGCAIGGLGPSAWPILLLAAIEPAEALASGSRRGVRAALVGGALALAAAAMAQLDPALPGGMVQAQIALAVLIAGALGRIGIQVLGRPDLPVDRALDRSMVEATGDLVTWHDRAGRVLRAGGAAARMTGLASGSLLGSGLFARVHVQDRPIFLKALDDAAAGPDPVTAEFRLHVNAPGAEGGPDAASFMWVEMRAHRFAPSQGSPACVVAFTRDASASRRHAEELDRARREAERANELKGRFLANVSHELRTPLNAIIGFSELMTVDHPFVLTDERRTEYATIINGSGRHLLEIVNTLLDMSKIETGNFDFAPEPLAVKELAHGCCDLIHIKAEQGGIALERAIAHDLPEIVGDRRALRQILINLLSNAVKFTAPGGRVTISVALEAEDVVLAVADTGIGIREADLPRLGDPFFQAGDLHRRSHEGTGLGLSVVRGLVGLHGGAMAIESGFGEGTTVTVRLPAFASDERGGGKPVAVATTLRGAVRGGEPARRDDVEEESRRMSA